MAQSDCTSTILTMASCLNYVTGASETPPASCCSALANVVQTNPRCLCAVINGGAQLGVSINSTLALSLPAVCNVQTPPVSRCNETSPGPAGSADNGTPDSSTTPSVVGSKATATTSNGSVTKMHLQLVGFLVLFVSTFVPKFSCI
ncbi:hypothetical protein ACH5RR_031328 [Cinchona calisaya]|uniref:Bifunctional inhibitor/plant lipid transfer protein/seed storage helical domain-containing protein n=1 Tax=Cinchona calisaya TaxID=153742 RepID=A0ABD2YGV7_9GENT